MPFRNLSKDGLVDSEIAKLANLFENIWAEYGAAFTDEPEAVVEHARNVIAKCLMYHARNGHTDFSALKALAIEKLEGAFPKLR